MIENLKDLERLLKLCRKQGVQELMLKDINFKLGEMPKVISNVEEEEERDPFMEALEAPISPEEAAQLAIGI